MNRSRESKQWIESMNRINESKQWIEATNQGSESMNRSKEWNPWLESMDRTLDAEANQWIEATSPIKESNQWNESMNRKATNWINESNPLIEARNHFPNTFKQWPHIESQRPSVKDLCSGSPVPPDHPGRTDGRTKKVWKNFVFHYFSWFFLIFISFS